MEVLLASDSFQAGGLETHLETFMKYTNILYPDIDLHFVSSFGTDFYFNGIDIYANLYSYEGSRESLIFERFSQQLRTFQSLDASLNFDLVIAHPFISLFSAFSFATGRKKPFIGVIHGKISAYYKNNVLNHFFHQVIRKNALIFCVNKSISRKLKLCWLPNPIDESFWRPRDLKDEDYILLVSRLDDDKAYGIGKFLERLAPGFRRKTLVVGDGSYLGKLKEAFPDVQFLGRASSSEVRDLMSKSTVVVGMGRVVLESLFLKKATILLNYNGDFCLIDSDDKFRIMEEFNFNGTNIVKSDIFDSRLWDRIKSVTNNVAIQSLEKYRASSVVQDFWKKTSSYLESFTPLDSLKELVFLEVSIGEMGKLEKEINYLRVLKDDKENLLELQKKKIEELSGELSRLEKAFKSEIGKLQEDIQKERSEKDKLYESLKYIESSKSWKVIKLYWNLKRKLKENFFSKRFQESKLRNQALSFIRKSKNRAWILSHPLVDWNIPLHQRPHHIAVNLARLGFTYFYSTTNTYDSVSGFQEIEERCYLTDKFDLLDKLDCGNSYRKIYHIHAADHNVDKRFLEERLRKGHLILYEYMDELHEDLSGSRVRKIIQRHKWVLENEEIMVVATAKKLYDEVARYRSKNFALVTNGVDVEHFRKATRQIVPLEIESLVRAQKPIIGYFGALAKWFDYDLVEFLASRNKNWNFLLIGWNYDGSLNNSSLLNMENVKILGPIPYESLPSYAVHFDVAIIPFVINEITLSTSPIKLFEYFALQKPVVSTSLPEVAKFPEALVANDKYDFEKKVKEALKLADDDLFREKLLKRAMENSWYRKAEQIKELIEENL